MESLPTGIHWYVVRTKPQNEERAQLYLNQHGIGTFLPCIEFLQSHRSKQLKKVKPLFPNYLFAKNKGYGTAEHIQALKKFGPSPHHRKTFLKKILGENN